MVLIIPSFRIKLSAGTYQTQTQISYFVYCVKRGETLFIRFPLGGLTTYPLRYSWNCMKRRTTCVFPIPFCFALQTTPRALINSDVKKIQPRVRIKRSLKAKRFPGVKCANFPPASPKLSDWRQFVRKARNTFHPRGRVGANHDANSVSQIRARAL